MESMRADDADWRSGRTWSLVYYVDDEHHEFLERAHNSYFAENGLNPMAFKSLKRMETEVVQMTVGMLHGPSEGVGTMTSGGTESILLAVKAARDRARKKRPWVRRPEVVLPRTAHVAFEKAAHYFGLKLRWAPIGDDRLTDISTTGLTLPGRDAQSNRLDAHLMAATVRLRIEDADGHSCGSGTIIDTRGGKALILTCGHIFRDSGGKGKIEVDLFGPTPAERVPGNLVAWDEKRDVGLLWIKTPGPVEVARVAPPSYQVSPGDEVVNAGCNNGDDPTARHSRVASLDKFMGPPNLQVGGLPVQGRSGGGLFSDEGLVIGVCNAADPQDNEGLYAALGSLYAELDEADLSHVYQPQDSQPQDSSQPAKPRWSRSKRLGCPRRCHDRRA